MVTFRLPGKSCKQGRIFFYMAELRGPSTDRESPVLGLPMSMQAMVVK
jgi:hypothetical protein